MSFEHLSSHALTAKLGELLASERRTVVAFLLHLAELERRQLHLELGYSSMHVFCTQHLKLTDGAAFRRTKGARLIARFPIIADYLTDGRLNLTTLALLRDVLDDASYVQILERAAGKTEDEVKLLVAALRPQPAPADLFRRLPAPELDFRAKVDELTNPTPAPAWPAGAEITAPIAAPTAARRPSLQPISAEQHVLRVTVGRDFVDDLARVKALLSHMVPDGNLVAVLHACIKRTIAHCETRRRGSDRPRPRKEPPPTAPTVAPRGRGISTPVRREVWRRDGGTCAFIETDGKRCASSHQIEFHHLEPFARGGPPTVDNLQLRCRPHNRHAAEADFGRDFMRSVIPGLSPRLAGRP